MPDAQRAAITKLEALHAEHPQGRIFTHLAEAYRKAGELERAREVLTAGLERHPDYSSAHVVLARVLLDMGETAQADSEFRRVLELDAHNLVALRALGDLARAAGRSDTALDYYRRLLEVEPADEDVRKLAEEMIGGGAAVSGDRGEARPEEPATAPAGRESGPEGEWGLEDELAGEPRALEEPAASMAAEPPEAGHGRPDVDTEPGAGVERELEDPLVVAAAADELVGVPPVQRPPEEDTGAAERPEPGRIDDPEAAFGAPEAGEPTEGEPEAREPEAREWEPEEPGLGAPELGAPQPDAPELEEPIVAAGAEDLLGGGPAGRGTEELELLRDEVEGKEASDWLLDAGGEWEEPPSGSAGEASSTETVEAFGWTGSIEAPRVIEDGEPAPRADTGEPELATETIAQVYARQGLYDRAAEVYRQLLRERPDDARLRSRLDEMEALASAPAPGTEPGIATGEETPLAGGALEGLEMTELHAAPDVAPLEGLEAQEIDPETGLAAIGEEPPALEPMDGVEAEDVAPPPSEEPGEPRPDAPVGGAEPDDEEAVESVWTGADGATRAEDSPYAWAEPEQEPDSDASPPIADYFRGLLRWGPRDAATPEPSSGAVPQEPAAPAGKDAAAPAGKDAAPAGKDAAAPVGKDAAAPAAEDAAAPGGRDAEASTDDDDLDVFRSWLESLKK